MYWRALEKALEEAAQSCPVVTLLGPRQSGNFLISIEIKASYTYTSDFLKGLIYFQNLVQDRSSKGFLIYAGDREQQITSVHLLNYRNAFKALS